jgi:hypothetical protein
MLPWLLACTTTPEITGEDITILTDLSEPLDECALPCVSLSGPAGASLSLTAAGLVMDSGSIDADGQLTLCPTQGVLTPEVPLAIEQDGAALLTTTLDVQPFGYAMGRQRDWGAPDALSWRTDWVLDPLPFFIPRASSWYSEAITSPHRVDDRLYFSGKDADDAPYRLGVVALDGEVAVGTAEELLLSEEGDWDDAGQVSPTVVTDTDGGLLLFYHGLSQTAEVPVLGRATSADGLTWSHPEASTYGDPLDNKVSHPTALIDGDGIIELWHLTEEGGVGLSLSADGGQTFTPSCVRLPMQGKSPEVVWLEDRYLMTWATVSQGEDVIRAAESLDGLRWREHAEPILWASDAAWTTDGMSNAQPTWIDGAPRLLLTGVQDGSHGIGLARPESEE